jgi:hypothetical protein
MSIHNKYRKDGCGLHSFNDDVDGVRNWLILTNFRNNTSTHNLKQITATGFFLYLTNLTLRQNGLSQRLSPLIGMLSAMSLLKLKLTKDLKILSTKSRMLLPFSIKILQD